MTDAPSLELLEAKSREELIEIAAVAGIPVPPRARKPGIINAILGGGSAGDDPGEGRTRTVTLPADDSAENGAPENEANEANGSNGADPNTDSAEDGNRRSRRRGRDEQFQGDAAPCDGLLDLREEGYGFLRISGLLPSPDDVYVAARHVRQYRLRRGDRITGASRPAARSEKNPALLRLDTINGNDPNPDEIRPLFDDIAVIHPATVLPLAKGSNGQNGHLSANEKQLLEKLDKIAPAGHGQRGLLVSDSQADSTALVETVAMAVGLNHPDIHLLVLLIDERPELITELSRRLETSGEVVASAFDRPADEHIAVTELTLERAKRKAEQGEDVVLVFDGLTRLARAHRRAVGHRQSQMTSEPAAAAAAKSLFGVARNLEQAGSITMFATARPDEGAGFDADALNEFRSAANLTWALENAKSQDSGGGAGGGAAGSSAERQLTIDEGACFSSGNHV